MKINMERLRMKERRRRMMPKLPKNHKIKNRKNKNLKKMRVVRMMIELIYIFNKINILFLELEDLNLNLSRNILK